MEVQKRSKIWKCCKYRKDLMRTQLSCTKKYKHSKTSFLVTIFDWECIFTAIFLHHNFWLFSKQYLLPHFLFFLQYFTSYTILNNNLDKKCYNNRINVAKKYRDLVGKYDLKLNEKDDLIEKAPFFYRTVPLWYHKLGNMVIFSETYIHFVAQETNYQKFICFLIFSSKRSKSPTNVR